MQQRQKNHQQRDRPDLEIVQAQEARRGFADRLGRDRIADAAQNAVGAERDDERRDPQLS